jgi:hypothetical protein
MNVLVIITLTVLVLYGDSADHSFVDQGVCKLCKHLIDKIRGLKPQIKSEETGVIIALLRICLNNVKFNILI